MNSIANAGAGFLKRLRTQDVAADELDLRGAVIADGLMFTEQDGGELTLHTIDGGRAELLGSFASAAEAWRALDEIDAPAAELDAAA